MAIQSIIFWFGLISRVVAQTTNHTGNSTIPTNPVTIPTDPITISTVPVTIPTDPVTIPTDPTTKPTKPTDPVTIPTDPTTKPTDPVTIPTDPTTKPTDPVTIPTDPTTKPTDPVTIPTDPTTKPTDLITIPTEPTTKPHHVYPPNCAPPTGFENNSTDVTTVDYVTLRPIERCCPQCSPCAEIGGFCALRWAVELYPGCCDFAPIDPCRDYSCTCCIKCGEDKCSPCVETGGNCRKECRSGELEDTTNQCSYYNNGTGCKCCKKCEAMDECVDAHGLCVTSPDNCEHGQFASTGCCGGCYCCKPVLEPVIGSNCALSGGYCSETEDCATGYYACFGECTKTTYWNGLRSIVTGYCCIPK